MNSSPGLRVSRCAFQCPAPRLHVVRHQQSGVFSLDLLVVDRHVRTNRWDSKGGILKEFQRALGSIELRVEQGGDSPMPTFLALNPPHVGWIGDSARVRYRYAS